MKKILVGFLAVASVSGYAQNIIFEEVNDSNIVIVNGGAQIEFGSTNLVIAPRSYPKGRVRIGDQVITDDMRDGEIKSMFLSTNEIVVKDAYYGNRKWTAGQIAVKAGCVGFHCVEDRVVTSDMREGTVKGYFGNGDIVVQDRYYGNRRWKASEIGLTSGCSSTFCTGDRVITSDGREGRIKAFFPNGSIAVADSYYGLRDWESRDISVTSGVCSNIYVQRVRFCH